jgi:hypothetical protein
MTRIRRSLSYANVMATVAVFLALGGAAWAALGRNAVRSRNIAPGAVKASDIGRQAVTGAKLKRGAVSGPKIAGSAVSAGKVAPQSLGSAQLGNSAVIARILGSNSVITSKIAANAVTGPKVDESSLGRVPDAQLLDGMAASKFMRTDRFGRTRVNAGTTVAGQTTQNIATFIGNQGAVDFTCDAGLNFSYRNTGAPETLVWYWEEGRLTSDAAIGQNSTLTLASDQAATDGSGSVEWLIRTDDTLIRMTTTAVGGTPCSYAVYYEEVTLGA